MNPSSPPLRGLRVLDFSSMMAGPYCGRWLADLGADVIKVESPEGDYMRSRPPLREGHSAYFGHLNAGKRSVILDLKTAQGRSVAGELACRSDVLIEGFRPGVMRRAELDYPTLRAIHPALVYCSISGWGQSGPRAQQPAYAAIVHAAVGFDQAWQAGQTQETALPECAVQIADVLAATFAAMGIQAALLARASTGEGRHVDVSLAEGMLSLMPLEVARAQFESQLPRTSYRAFDAADGSFVVLPLSQKNFNDLCDGLGLSHLKDDPRFCTPAVRVKHWEEMRAVVAAWAATRPASECVRVLEQAGVPVTLYGSVRSSLDDGQVLSRGFLQKAHDPAGSFRIAGLPFQLDGERWSDGSSRPVPSLGQHTREVLREVLDLDPPSLDRLAGSGAFGPASAAMPT